MIRVAISRAAAVTSIGDSLMQTFVELAAGRHGFTDLDRFDVATSPNKRAALRRQDGSAADLALRVQEQILGSDTSLSIDRAYIAGAPDGPAVTLHPAFELSSTAFQDQEGWNRYYSGACVASSTALIDAAAIIASGEANRVLVVAARRIEDLTFFPFSSAGAMTQDSVPRPLTRDRSGLLLGDGAAAFILEAEGFSADEPLAEFSGWGRAGDGFHICQPEPGGRGMVEAIKAALGRAKLSPTDIDHISVHGTATPLNDAAEVSALHSVFGDHLRLARLSSAKSAIGHTLEAAGLVEAAIATQAIRKSTVPPNLGMRPEDETICDGVAALPSEEADIDHVLSTNLAFGGSNTAIVISRWREEPRPFETPQAGSPELQVISRVGTVPDSPTIPGFIASTFAPAIYDAAFRCFEKANLASTTLPSTSILLLSPGGDIATRNEVRATIDNGKRLSPLLFVQSTPSSIVGKIARDWGLRGAITTLSTKLSVDDPSILAMVKETFSSDGCRLILVLREEPDESGINSKAEAVLYAPESGTQ